MDTRQQASFRIEAPVGKLLDLFTQDTTVESALECLAAQYPWVSYDVLSADVEAAVRFLTENGLLAREAYEEMGDSRGFHVNTRYFQRYTIRENLLYTALLEVTYRCPER